MYLHIHTIYCTKVTPIIKTPPLPPAKQKDDASTPSCRTKESFHACQACMQALTTPVTPLPGLTLGWGAGCMYGKLKKRYVYMCTCSRHWYTFPSNKQCNAESKVAAVLVEIGSIQWLAGWLHGRSMYLLTLLTRSVCRIPRRVQPMNYPPEYM